MLKIINNQTNPYFNIASEEYFLKNFHEDVFMLYCNNPSVIIGKHQNAFAEINYQFLKVHHIPVIRRLSGGGAVYHDTGNLNFTFIRNGAVGKQLDFNWFIMPILQVLNQLGVPAVQNQHHDILIHGLKCSGNAEHIYKNRTLHHGTLLFESNMSDLHEALHADLDTFVDKAVKSKRSNVTNIKEHLNSLVPFENFKDQLVNYICEAFTDVTPYFLTSNDQLQINRLADEKYKNWNWNFGYSPKFLLKKNKKIGGCDFELSLNIENGIIIDVKLSENGTCLSTAAKLLIGLTFQEEVIAEKFSVISRNPNLLKLLFFN